MLQRSTKLYSQLVSLLILLAIVLVACGSNASSSNGNVTVNWWSWNPGPPLDTQFVNAFNASHPHIKLVYKFQQYDDYINNLKLSMASETGPDIFGVQAGVMPKTYAPFMEDLTPYAQKAWGASWSSRFYDAGLAAFKSGNATSALPFFVSGAAYLWYNKTIFDKYGLKPPTTFDQWVAVCLALQNKGITPFVQGGKDAWANYDMYIALANMVAPGKFYDAEAGKISWTDPDLVKAMDYWHQMFHNGIMQKGALALTTYPQAATQFETGKAAMIVLGSWESGDMTKTNMAAIQTQNNMKDTFEFLPAAFPGLSASAPRARLFGGPDVGLALNKDSQNKDAAWQVIQWLTSPQGQEIYAKNLSEPAVKGINIDDSDIITDNQKTALKTIEQDLANISGPREIAYPEIQTALADALQNVATDSQTPQQALAAVQQASQSIKR